MKSHSGRKKKPCFPLSAESSQPHVYMKTMYKWAQQEMRKEQERLNIRVEVGLNAGNEHKF